MKKALTIGVAGVAMAATLSLVAASSFKRDTTPGTRALAANDTGSMALNNGYTSTYTGVAHIIHVPQRGERASVDERDEPGAIDNDDVEPLTPPPRRRATPRWPRQSKTPPPPPGPRRTVLSAPPPPAEGPTPIRPTPRFGYNPDRSEQFSAPDNAAVTPEPSLPPADTMDPAALPRGN